MNDNPPAGGVIIALRRVIISPKAKVKVNFRLAEISDYNKTSDNSSGKVFVHLFQKVAVSLGGAPADRLEGVKSSL